MKKRTNIAIALLLGAGFWLTGVSQISHQEVSAKNSKAPSSFLIQSKGISRFEVYDWAVVSHMKSYSQVTIKFSARR